MKYKVITFEKTDTEYQIKEQGYSELLRANFWLVRHKNWGKKFETIIDIDTGLIIMSTIKKFDITELEKFLIASFALKEEEYKTHQKRAIEAHWEVFIK